MAERGVNKVILIGNLGQDPEVRYMPSGDAVANISIATSETWKDKQTGEQKERTEWHRVSIFGKVAEIAGEYLRKGSKVYIEGQLQTRKWQDQNGQDRYTTEIAVRPFNGSMQMLGDNGQQPQQQNQQQGGWGQPQQTNGGQPYPQQQQAAPQSQPQSQPQQQYNDLPDFDDDIPFN